MHKYLPIIIASVLLPAYPFIMWGGYYELFVFEPMVHYPRVTTDKNQWGEPTVVFSVNTPTVTAFFILLGGLLSVYGALKTHWAFFLKRPGPDRIRYGIYQGLGFAIAVIAYTISINDFFSTAFEGVG